MGDRQLQHHAARKSAVAHRLRFPTVSLFVLTAAALGGCLSTDDSSESDDLEFISNSKNTPVDGSEAPSGSGGPLKESQRAKKDGPTLGVVQMAATIYEKPDRRSKKLGYLRVGSKVARAVEAAGFDGCEAGFYEVLPHGFVCAQNAATLDMEHPLLRAEIKGPNRHAPLPYEYSFVRAIAPRYYRMPTYKEQLQYEMSLKRHLKSYRLNHKRWNRLEVGSNDVTIDPLGIVLSPAPTQAPDPDEIRKYAGSDGNIPWFFEGKRQIPNVSNFKVPKYAVITNRIKRHAGVAIIDAFHGEKRDFALTTDLRLVPTSKLKPGRGSVFHGVEVAEGWELPVAFVRKDGAYHYDKARGQFKRIKKRYAYGAPIQLTGESRRDGKRRYLETEEGVWMRNRDLAIVAKNSKFPQIAKKGVRWIDVSIHRQTLVLYDGRNPVYATMVSTGRDGLGDPRKTHSTPLGTFTIRDKHVTNTMDSQIVGGEFELNDVPWVQYFKAGYALHASYWHTDYGRPRSHGCINLSPIDAHRIFQWTAPAVPGSWHGASAGETMGTGTQIHIHP